MVLKNEPFQGRKQIYPSGRLCSRVRKENKFASLTSDFIHFSLPHEPRRAEPACQGARRAPWTRPARQNNGKGPCCKGLRARRTLLAADTAPGGHRLTGHIAAPQQRAPHSPQTCWEPPTVQHSRTRRLVLRLGARRPGSLTCAVPRGGHAYGCGELGEHEARRPAPRTCWDRSPEPLVRLDRQVGLSSPPIEMVVMWSQHQKVAPAQQTGSTSG